MSLKPTRPLPAHEGAERLVLGALLLSSAAIPDLGALRGCRKLRRALRRVARCPISATH